MLHRTLILRVYTTCTKIFWKVDIALLHSCQNMASGKQQLRDDFRREKHVKFFLRCLQIIPGRYASLDTSRMTVAFFAISGLDILNSLTSLEKDKEKIVNWIYSLQVLPDSKDTNLEQCGFRGSATIGATSDSFEASKDPLVYDSGHIAMTYTALLSLLVLGDDLSRVNRRGVLAGLRKLQLPDGSFCPTPEGSENDMRFVYCACCISYVLDDWSGLDIEKAIAFIGNSLSYEGAFGQGPELEAHGGTTFCAVAALVLMGRLNEVLTSAKMDRLKRWCIMRQQSGFHGRPNKPVDTCYSFWVGATLSLLGLFEMIDDTCNRSFLMETQDCMVGGFGKWPDNTPDPLHAYFGVCGLSLMHEPGLQPMHAALNISQAAADHISSIHNKCLNCVSNTQPQLVVDKHTQFLLQCLKRLPPQSVAADTSRVTIALFSLGGLDLLGALDKIPSKEKKTVIEWIYSLQVIQNDNSVCRCGFRGSPVSKTEILLAEGSLDGSHLAMTFSALCCLLILQDSLEAVDRIGIIRGMVALQQPSGSFSASISSYQCDMKFLYCAVCVCVMMNDTSSVNITSILSFIKDSQSYEGGFGQSPGLEAHGGATFCAVASLVLLGQLYKSQGESGVQRITRWCLCRQQSGFSGRTNRPDDPSYSFWISATLKLLGSLQASDIDANRDFLLSTQSVHTGGFSQSTGMPPDPLHSFFTLCGLSLLDVKEVKPLHTALNISEEAANHMRCLHSNWSNNLSE